MSLYSFEYNKKPNKISKQIQYQFMFSFMLTNSLKIMQRRAQMHNCVKEMNLSLILPTLSSIIWSSIKVECNLFTQTSGLQSSLHCLECGTSPHIESEWIFYMLAQYAYSSLSTEYSTAIEGTLGVI